MPLSVAALNAALEGRYTILRELGAGGMATVFLADDLKHDRKVAVKVLKPELAAVLGAERFVVEIKTTASLQHPHILPLFDSGTADGFLYYVMPFIEGETLRDKLNRETQLGVDESVRIACDVADALHYAHTRGVIHRDIKPENILLANGRPMVADFGIALAVSAAAGGRMTETGLSLGTPHYMSPEQATADKEITARSDVYSLGSVLYEMLAGQPPHLGGSAQQIIMKIIAEQPQPVTAIRKSVPPNVAAAVAKSLEKLPADRFHSAQAFIDALKNVGFTIPSMTGVHVAHAGSRWKQRAALPLAGALAIALIAIVWMGTRPVPTAPVTRYDLSLGNLVATPSSDVVISPDGTMLAFVGITGDERTAVYLRRLNGEAEFRRLPGSDNANASPTFSPDSKSIAFRRQSDGALLKLDIATGSASTIAKLGNQLGTFLHWGTPELLVYSGGPKGIFRVPSAGGTPEFLEKTAGADRYSFLLPDGSGLLYSRNSATVYVLDFRTDSQTLLVEDAVHPVYAKGRLLFVGGNGGLFAVPFDLSTKRISGAPVRVIENVAAATAQRGFSVSANGTLVLNEGAANLAASGATPNRLAIVDMKGAVQPIALPRGRYGYPSFSKDGRSIAFEARTNRNNDYDIYTFNLASKTSTQLTFSGNNQSAVWSPDGKRIAFGKTVDTAGADLFVKASDNSSDEQRVLALPGGQLVSDWITNDTLLLHQIVGSEFSLASHSLKGGTAPVVFERATMPTGDPRLSPDGKLVAYFAREAGTNTVWIRDYPSGHGRWKIPATSITSPRWSRDGKYLYVWKTVSALGDSLLRMRIDRTPSVVVGSPEFVTQLVFSSSSRNWDLHPDGTKFVAAIPELPSAIPVGAGSAGAQASRYLIVTNWFEELLARTTTGK